MSFSTNKSAFKTFRKTIAAAGTAEQLPNVPVPDGHVLVIKALDSNTGDIEIGETQAIAQGSNPFVLKPGQAVELDIVNANLIWADVTVAGNGVSGIVEQN